MSKRIIFATGNEGKMREIREILGDLGYEVLSMKDAGISADIIENGSTFEENARIKARAVADLLPAGTEDIVLADDSGLEVDYLNKEPGIYSARYMGEDTSYEIKNQNIIDRLAGVPREQRTARFVCAIAAVFCCRTQSKDIRKLPVHDGEEDAGITSASTRTECVCSKAMEGYIGEQSTGNNGFGYDPIFFVDSFGCSTAELNSQQKNEISHRGKALREMKEVIKAHENIDCK